MQEYSTSAIILTRDEIGEYDNLVSCFTKRYGKLFCRTRSTRKLHSKLSAHLQPGALVHARIVEKKQPLLVDCLRYGAISPSITQLHQLNHLLPECQEDERLWDLLTNPTADFSWERILSILGWGGSGAACSSCKRSLPDFFSHEYLQFYCQSCVFSLSLPVSRLLQLGSVQ